MKKIIIALFVLVLANYADAQQWQDPWVDHIWTDGSETLVAVPLNNSQVLFVANGYCDAGYGYLFETKKTGEFEYDMKGIPESKVKSRPKSLDEISKGILDGENANGDDGQVAKRREIGGFDLLLFYNTNGSVSRIFEPTSREMQEVALDGIQRMFVGTYTTSKGVKYQFNEDGTCIFAGKKNTYYFLDEGEKDAPSSCIVVDRRMWELVPTFDGMKIYLAEHNQEGETVRKGLQASLKASKKSPRWSFTSKRPVTGYAIDVFNDKSLTQLVRNEIFARHGYRFSDPKLKAYFESCSWYHPVDDNSKVVLNEMEKINVSYLKAQEK